MVPTMISQPSRTSGSPLAIAFARWLPRPTKKCRNHFEMIRAMSLRK